MERVLGNLFPSTEPRSPQVFVSEFQGRRWTMGSTVSEVHVFMLDSIVNRQRD
jgi:hypothetical protein